MSNLSVGSGVIVVFLITGSPDRVSALSSRVTTTRIRPVIRGHQLEGLANRSRFPAAFRPPAFASRSSDSRRGVGPSSRSAYRPTAGPRRGYRVPHARAATGEGALCTPGTTVLIPAGDRAWPASAASQRQRPCTPPPALHLAGLHITRHQRRFKQFTRPVFPSPAAARMERAAASAFPRASHPADQEPDDARRGGDRPTEHGPGTTLYDISRSSNRACSLITCDVVVATVWVRACRSASLRLSVGGGRPCRPPGGFRSFALALAAFGVEDRPGDEDR